MFTACARVQDSSKLGEEEREALEKIVCNYNDKDSGIKAEYDEKNNCINLSWQGETLTTSYNLHFRDLLTENPTSYADGFIISMVAFQKGVTDIVKLQFVLEGITFDMIPLYSNTIDDRGITMAGFGIHDESTKKCLGLLSHLASPVPAKIYTNMGTFKLPDEDILSLMSMTRSYIMDGGKFE
jgi:hypothetical protein